MAKKEKNLAHLAQALSDVVSAPEPRLIAKKDFEIRHNDYHRKITAGEDISDVPERYHQNLKTEGVL